MKSPRFKISKDGKQLLDTKTGIATIINEFEIKVTATGANVIFNKHQKVSRWNIDESEFSLGPTSAKTESKKKESVERVPTATGILFTKEELVELHEAHLNAANLTLRKLVKHIKEN